MDDNRFADTFDQQVRRNGGFLLHPDRNDLDWFAASFDRDRCKRANLCVQSFARCIVPVKNRRVSDLELFVIGDQRPQAARTDTLRSGKSMRADWRLHRRVMREVFCSNGGHVQLG